MPPTCLHNAIRAKRNRKFLRLLILLSARCLDNWTRLCRVSSEQAMVSKRGWWRPRLDLEFLIQAIGALRGLYPAPRECLSRKIRPRRGRPFLPAPNLPASALCLPRWERKVAVKTLIVQLIYLPATMVMAALEALGGIANHRQQPFS